MTQTDQKGKDQEYLSLLVVKREAKKWRMNQESLM